MCKSGLHKPEIPSTCAGSWAPGAALLGLNTPVCLRCNSPVIAPPSTPQRVAPSRRCPPSVPITYRQDEAQPICSSSFCFPLKRSCLERWLAFSTILQRRECSSRRWSGCVTLSSACRAWPPAQKLFWGFPFALAIEAVLNSALPLDRELGGAYSGLGITF